MTTQTTSQAFFEEKYQREHDPWNFASSSYEQGRYVAIATALGHRRYQHAFEPACSIGELTIRLASICERVDATDISPTAVIHARERCRTAPHVNINCGALPDNIPAGTFDLVVLSEVGYYFNEEQLRGLAEDLVGRTRPGGVLLAAHWLGISIDHVLSGDQVHRVLEQLQGLDHEYAERHAGFRLDRWVRS